MYMYSPVYLVQGYTRVLVTTWGHDPTSVFVSNLLLTVNDALTHSSVLIQVSSRLQNESLLECVMIAVGFFCFVFLSIRLMVGNRMVK